MRCSHGQAETVCGKGEEKAMAIVNSKSRAEKVLGGVNVALLLCLTLVFLYPVWYCLVASFSKPDLLTGYKGVLFWPLGFSTAGYKAVLNNQNITTGYLNTLLYVTTGSCLGMVFTCAGAYFMSRRGLMLSRALTLIIVLTMYVDAGMIPRFLLIKGLGLYNTRWAVLLPDILNTYNLIVMRTAFASVPAELEESAQLDGASDLTILWKILLPVTKATIAVIVLFYVVAWWNSWFNACLYVRDRDKYPLQLFLREILIANTTDGNDGNSQDGMYYLETVIKYCSIIVSTLPILCAYPFVQKYFVKGVMIGSVKG